MAASGFGLWTTDLGDGRGVFAPKIAGSLVNDKTSNLLIRINQEAQDIKDPLIIPLHDTGHYSHRADHLISLIKTGQQAVDPA